MNEDDFLAIEAITRRAVQAASVFASPEVCACLNQLERLVAELRQASQTLCQPSASAAHCTAATQRLTDIFLPF